MLRGCSSGECGNPRDVGESKFWLSAFFVTPKAQQHRPARPQGCQKSHPTDARIQVVLECSNPHWRHRDYAHDQEGADGLSRWINHVRSTAVLQPCCLITGLEIQLLSARLHYRDKIHLLAHHLESESDECVHWK